MDRKHQLVSEIKRLAAELGRTPSRDQFAKHTGISTHQITSQFGGYVNLIQSAGLTINPRTAPPSSHEKKCNKYQPIRTALRAFDDDIRPWVGKYARKHKGTITVITAADFHGDHVDPFAASVFLDTCKRIQPDAIALAGDIVDFWEVSTYSKDPLRANNLQSEIDHVKDFLRTLRESCSDSEIDYLWGNHENRLFRYLCGQSDALASLDSLKFPTLFGLDELEINLVANNTFLTQTAGRFDATHKIYGDAFLVTHGTSTTQNHAKAELTKWNISGASGHVHHYQTQSRRDIQGNKQWTSMGCMCTLDSGKDYIPDLVRWSNGFLITHIDKQRVIMEPINMEDGFTCVAGVYYYRKSK